MVKYVLTSILVLLINIGFSQVILFQDNFENSVVSWDVFSTSSPNTWLANVCAGNGPSDPDPDSQVAFYITGGGPTNLGCGSGSAINYYFQNSDNGGVKQTVLGHEVIATCAQSYQLQFDYLIGTDGVSDYAEVVYSTNNGSSWTAVGGILPTALTWTTTTVNLPAVLNNTNFLFGFRFSYNEAGNSGLPLAIDNVRLTGIDNSNPTAICPGSQAVYVTQNCTAELLDFTALMSGTDPCYTTAAPLTYTQSPVAGTIISQNTTLTMTAQDPAGNQGTCTFQVVLVDTIKPVPTCLEEMTVNLATNCDVVVPDLTATVSVVENCGPSSLLTFTQSPAAGAIVTGITNVYVTVTDSAGNAQTCGTRLIPNDVTAPVVTCPSNLVVDNGVSCAHSLADYTAQAVVVEACPNYTIAQSPAPGTSVGTGMNVLTFEVTDEVGNVGTCSFVVTVEESIPPVISNCPAAISTCNPIVTFATILAADNCVAFVEQTDATGLTSGATFPVGITTLSFTAYDSTGNTDVCTFTVEVLPSPSQALITADTIDLCVETNYTLEANVPTTGTGTWSIIQGSGTLADPTNAQTAVSNLSSGANTFVWTISTTSCGVSKDTIVVNNNPLPTTVSILSDSTFACNASTYLLLGTFPASGDGLWTTLEGATIANPGNHNTQASNFAPGWNTFIYTISSGNCPASADTIHVYANNQAQIFTNDTTLCFESDFLNLAANAPVATQSAAWYFAQGQADVAQGNAPITSVSNFTASANQLVYRLSHPICGFTYDTLQIQVNNCESDEIVIPTIITPNFDGKNDLFVVINLHELYPDCVVSIVNRWGSKVFESNGYATPWDGTNDGEPLPSGTYFYKIQLNDADERVLTGPISIIR